jgi:signal transduction histidine kinase
MADIAPDSTKVVLDPALAERLRTAQDFIVSRPRISIRLRFTVSLALCFCLCALAALVNWTYLHQVRSRLLLLGTTESVAFDLEQARRFEKDFFLYGTNLDDAVRYAESAAARLQSETPQIAEAAAPDEVLAISRHLGEYRRLLTYCQTMARARILDPSRRQAIEASLRHQGSTVTALVEGLTSRERKTVTRMLKVSETLPMILLIALLVLFVLISYFFTEALLNPIRRFQAYTRRIAEGDFTLIRPARTYRDEFSDLALAVNRMLADLQATQQRCVEAGKLAAVGTITSGIAHEINNPLNNISLTTEALMEDFKTMSDEKKWNFLQDIYFETERASEIVKSLLDFTRTEKIERVPLDVSGVILSTQRLLQNEMMLNGVTFECDLRPDLPQIKGAENQLRQVFLNLFINAIHAMPRGGTLRVKANLHEEERVCVEVQDQGEGIPPEVLPHVFDPFFTTKEPGKGTGLGLSVSLSIIKRHGGDIQVESEPGRGTTFHVCLPRADRA